MTIRHPNNKCDDPLCFGAFINTEGLNVERCDICKLYANDDQAAAAINRAIGQYWQMKDSQPRHPRDIPHKKPKLTRSKRCTCGASTAKLKALPKDHAPDCQALESNQRENP
jgi:hypothetical protein